MEKASFIRLTLGSTPGPVNRDQAADVALCTHGADRPENSAVRTSYGYAPGIRRGSFPAPDKSASATTLPAGTGSSPSRRTKRQPSYANPAGGRDGGSRGVRRFLPNPGRTPGRHPSTGSGAVGSAISGVTDKDSLPPAVVRWRGG